MPDWVQGVIPNIPRFGAVFALFPVCFKVFAWVEDRLSINAKEEISAWLKSTGNFATTQILAFNLSHFHSQLFGDKQFSVKCFVRTLLFSIISFVIVFFSAFVEFLTFLSKYQKNELLITVPGQRPALWPAWDAGLAVIVYLSLLFIFVVLPLDFLGVGLTRELARRAKDDIGLKKGLLIFMLDTLMKTVIFPVVYLVAAVIIVMAIIMLTAVIFTVFVKLLAPVDMHIYLRDFIQFFFFWITNATPETPETPDKSLLSNVLDAYTSLLPSLLPSFLLCSAWVWLYLIGLHLVRRAVFLFDVDKQPVRSIGIIGAAVLTGCCGLYTTIGLNLRFGYALSSDEIAYHDQQRAMSSFNVWIRLDPKSVGLFVIRSLFYYSSVQRDYDRAVADLSDAIRLDPKSAGPFFIRGRVYAAKRDYDRAIADYTEAIRLDPKPVLLSDRGNAYRDKHDYDRAIADYTEAIRLDPKYAIAFNNRGRAYIAKQDSDSAIADYTEAIRLDPKFALAFRRRGTAYSAKQDYDRAIASLNDAVRLEPKSAVTVLWLYLMRARSGAETAASELETNAKNLNQPDWPYPLVELFLGRRTLETTFAAATKLDERCTAQFYVGEWQLLRDDRLAAKVSMTAAVEICPKDLIEYDVALAELQRLRP
ncbi:MAG TPA: tetratricopeptide repeat protein [Methylocella sp.]